MAFRKAPDETDSGARTAAIVDVDRSTHAPRLRVGV